MKLLKDNIKAATDHPLNFQRPANLLNKRKQYIEYSASHYLNSSSSFSEVSPASGRDLEKSVANTGRQISPASCSSEVAVKSCGLCGLMPSCASSQNQSKDKPPDKITHQKGTIEASDDGTAKCESSHIQNKVRKSSILETTTQSNSVNKSKDHKFDSSMDRSVDSIGSCSLDVDADSTDFSGRCLYRRGSPVL